MNFVDGRHARLHRVRAGIVAVLVLAAPALRAAEPPPAPILAAAHPLAGRIWAATGAYLAPDDLILDVLAHNLVLLGETHDNADHHALQAWIARRLAAAGRRPVVAFEMMETDQQDKIDAHLARDPGDVEGIGPAVDWAKRGWNPWDQYSPIARAALEAGGALKAANPPRDLQRQIGRGKEDEVAARLLGLDRVLPPGEQEAFAAEIRAAHCDLLPEGAVNTMVRVQRAKDATMAEILAAQAARPEVGPVVLIAGAGHVRRNRGVPVPLAQTHPELRPLSIAFVEVKDGVDEPVAYGERFGMAGGVPFDLVWFTARAERGDQCAALARQMKKK